MVVPSDKQTTDADAFSLSDVWWLVLAKLDHRTRACGALSAVPPLGARLKPPPPNPSGTRPWRSLVSDTGSCTRPCLCSPLGSRREEEKREGERSVNRGGYGNDGILELL